MNGSDIIIMGYRVLGECKALNLEIDKNTQRLRILMEIRKIENNGDSK